MPVACQTGDRPVAPRVRKLGASACAGRHILSVLFNTSCSAGPWSGSSGRVSVIRPQSSSIKPRAGASRDWHGGADDSLLDASKQVGECTSHPEPAEFELLPSIELCCKERV